MAGDAALIDTLIQRARSYVYTTALPPAIAAATRAALRLVQHEPWRRERLRSLVQRFRAGAASHGPVSYTHLDVYKRQLVGRSLHFELPYDCGLAVGALLFGAQQWLIRERSRAACLQAFQNNNYFGAAIFAGILLQYATRG